MEYNKLCSNVRDEKLLEQNTLFEEWFYGVMQEGRNETSEEKKKILNESRIVPYSDDWESIKNITGV